MAVTNRCAINIAKATKCKPAKVSEQAAEASHPSKAALDHPAARQQDKAMLGSRQLGDFKTNTMLCGIRCGLIT